MEDKLKILTEKLYKDGIEEGNKKANEIILKAKTESDKIISDAKTKAETLIKDADLNTKSLKERINGELNVSFNQTVNQLKNKISEVLTLKLVDTDEINTSLMKQEFVEKSILSILKNWDLNTADAVGTTIHFNENSEKNISKFVNKTCASYLKKGLEIKFDRTGSGFSISPKDSSFEISFDDESLLNFFKSNLKPYTKKVLFN